MRAENNYESVRGQLAEGLGEQMRKDRMDIRTRGMLAQGVLLACPEPLVLGRRMSNLLLRNLCRFMVFSLSPNVCA